MDRPVVCTEYMARPRGSLFSRYLPVFKQEGVGAFNWGLVSGKTQTIYPWGSPGGEPEPDLWFHDIFHPDGRPYASQEVDLILFAYEIVQMAWEISERVWPLPGNVLGYN